MSVLAAPKSLHFAEWSWELEAGGARGWQMPVAVWSSVCLLPQRAHLGGSVSPSCAQCQEGTVGASSKAHWEGLGLALGCCESAALKTALISPG